MKPEAAVVYICLLIKLLYLADCVRIYLLQINHTDVFIYCKLTILLIVYVFIYLQINHTDVFIYWKLTILMYLFIAN